MIAYNQSHPTQEPFTHYIYQYTSSIGSLDTLSEKFVARAFPTFYTQLYFEFYGGISKLQTENSTTHITKRTYVKSGIDAWFDIYDIASRKTDIPVKNFKVDLFPHTLYEVFGLSPKEILNVDLSVEDIWGNKESASVMLERLEGTTSHEEMITIFESYFLHEVKTRNINSNQYTPQFLEYHNSLQEFSKKLGYSTRWVQSNYRDILGVGFKELQSNMRFLKTLKSIDALVQTQDSINFSLLALECDYYDQAHFIKEFKRFSGMTPAMYLKTYYNNTHFYW